MMSHRAMQTSGSDGMTGGIEWMDVASEREGRGAGRIREGRGAIYIQHERATPLHVPSVASAWKFMFRR